ncbi:hypothetical protein [Pseudomonas sp. S1Bt23]|jgi:hypothetical protein|uniref:hypothetical protein n=1 Tax=Pseudomonas sp. S1Bt23 TaxID=3095074 RepID=UPI002A59BE06|nr:hypothetical protein [Pseudomonas sp. S1Bt23]WPO44881.1 hypothetical protein SHB59_16260 [Pseudomonas sp. S1Bt23]
MANVKQTKLKKVKMAERAAAQMEIHFPEYPEEWVWRRGSNNGFTTLPRSLPIAMQAVDCQTKGKPAGHTLFCLWARSPDHPLIVIENQATFAGEAGFQGARAVDTWRRRMKVLKQHRFIDTKPGTSGEFHYVLLLNPNVAVENMRRQNMIQDELYGRFIDRVAEIGAMTDLNSIRKHWEDEEKKAEPAVEKIAPKKKSRKATKKID